MTRMSEAEYQKLLAAGNVVPVETTRKAHKHHAQPQSIDGHYFKSKGEATRYGFLRRALMLGLIADLRIAPRFELQPAFTHRGTKYRAVTYTADFAYVCGGVEWVEDWKRQGKGGLYVTKDARLTHKLFLYRYPDVNFWLNGVADALPTVAG